MKAGSTFAYEPTQSIATNGAIRQTAITTRTGVTTGGVTTGGVTVGVFPSGALGASGASDIRRLRPLADHLCNAQEI
ncbi:hypothetical protein GCM10018775_85620 [Streptomyces umbrinus]|nr:hypothetical protein GCM10018775_85620 [Streptomyces umbrinus]